MAASPPKVSVELADAMRCSQCEAYLSVPPITINPTNGQYTCGRCASRIRRGRIRDKMFEKMAGPMSFPCRYAGKGCHRRKRFGAKMKKHEHRCRFAGESSPAVVANAHSEGTHENDDEPDFETLYQNSLRGMEVDPEPEYDPEHFFDIAYDSEPDYLQPIYDGEDDASFEPDCIEELVEGDPDPDFEPEYDPDYTELMFDNDNDPSSEPEGNEELLVENDFNADFEPEYDMEDCVNVSDPEPDQTEWTFKCDGGVEYSDY